LLLLSSVAKAQTLSCDGLSFNGGWGGGGFSMALPFRADAFCNNGPGEQVLYRSGDGSMVVTAKNVLHLDGQGLRVEAGGTADCTNFPKQIVITFSQPVANFQVEIYGAKTATDNRGYTVHLSPPVYPEEYYAPGRPMFTGVAFFPGAGITSVTISDPFEYDVNDVGYSLDGFWEMFVMNGRWISESRYKECGCGRPVITRPQTQTVSSNWPVNGPTDFNWSMQAEVSDDDGLVLRDVRLGQRYMAEKLSVPYYTLETINAQEQVALPKGRGELKPNSVDATMRSRLVNYYVTTDDEKLVVEATYLVDRIPASSQSCLHITQRYEFYKQGLGPCEPSGEFSCARWKPVVKYEFYGLGGETLKSINIAQRQHLRIANYPTNSVGLFKDCDTVFTCAPTMPNGGSVPGILGFERKFNPLYDEWHELAVSNGQSTNKWDNIHQTNLDSIEEPRLCWTCLGSKLVGAGCPECSHSHWRWSASMPSAFGGGRILELRPGSQQDFEFAVVKGKPCPFGDSTCEDDPNDFTALVNGERIRHPATGSDAPLQVFDYSAPDDVVLWYSGTGRQKSDAFFAFGGFFSGSSTDQPLYQNTGGSFSQSLKATASGAQALSSNSVGVDGLTSIIAADLYASGPTTISPFDPNLPGPLPTGYSAYNNLSYDINTDAQASGPFTVTFSVPSVDDQEVFNNLRVFHAERDPFEPDKAIWVDRTALSPDPQAPDFAARTINAKTRLLGQFVVAALTGPPPTTTATADLSIIGSHTPAQVIAGSNQTYTFNITNQGPQAATAIKFADNLPPNSEFVSVTTTQGSCMEEDGRVACKLDTLGSGGGAVVTIAVKLTEGGRPYPPEGKTVTSTAVATANESDSNQANNIAIENSTVLPDPNAGPTVSITSPTADSLIVGPVNISIAANASDSDGTVSKVEFFDSGASIGTGTAAGVNQYSLDWNNLSFGQHSLVAVVTDNLGKSASSIPLNFIVNGSAEVSITSPFRETAFNKPANITVTANASLGSGTISKTDFYANGALIGTATATGTNQYSVTWNNAPVGRYTLTAVVTDDSGVKTTSTPIMITVNDRPVISLLSPISGALFSASSSIPLIANASDGDGSITKVDFYANGSLIGSSATLAASQFPFTWNNVPAGSYSLTAVATDNLNGTTTSSPVNITVNSPPSVSVTSPAYGAQFMPPANINLTANATDSDGNISQVNFYANGSLIGAGTPTGSNQYSFTWSNVGFGSHSITARATDNSGTTTASGAINITVNSPPAVSLTSPVNGAAFAAPASVTINANASDNDGSVAKVEFFQNSVKLGEDTTSPYSFIWNNAGAGSYTLTAVATDNLGSITTSSPVGITVKPSALFVTGSTTLNSSDAAIQTRLQTLGYAVVVRDAKAALSTDANGKAVVVISSTVSPTNLSTKFRTVTVPVVIWESLSYFDMGMTAKGTTAANTATGQTQVKIVQPTHQLAGGLTGTQTVVTVSSTFAWGKPGASAAAVATMVSDTTKVIIFGYDKGAAMPGLAAPARRVGLFMNDTTTASFNGNGWTLFDAAINWATSPTP
jgi:uncharacterized repeat protein (TIGR01451 family)